MKILFVCRANIGRSQAAMGFYNQLFPGQSDSAGTIVDNPGEILSSRNGATNIIAVMKEQCVDMSANTRTQLTERMLEDYEKVIVMAEPETIPAWLLKNPKTTVWTIIDPKDQSMEVTRHRVSEIKSKVDELI